VKTCLNSSVNVNSFPMSICSLSKVVYNISYELLNICYHFSSDYNFSDEFQF
jgi:hypothetical protein